MILKNVMLGCIVALGAVVAQAVPEAVAPHPRLLADAQTLGGLGARLGETEQGCLAKKMLLDQADRSLKAPPPVYKKDASGKRILSVSRRTLAQIGTLALAYRITGNPAYAAKAIVQARTAAAFSDWNPSHFLDTAEMTFALALCYDWLYDALEPADREALYEAILHKGLLNPAGKLWEGWWVKANNNWAQVCHGGLVAGAIAIADRNPALARETIDRAVACLPISMGVFAPDGGFPEGPTYWQYALDYNLVAIWAIEHFDGTDHGLCSLPGFAAEVEFLDACTGPTGGLFNYSDAGSTPLPRREPSFPQWWLARRFNRPDSLAFCERALLASHPSAASSRFFPLYLLCLGKVPETSSRAPLARIIGGRNPIAVMRTSWTDPDAWYAGAKGGSPRNNHGHMDLGSFVLEAKGVRWVSDLGCESYAQIEAAKVSLWNMKQDSGRWNLFRYATRGHGTLQFNSEQQRVSASASFSPLVHADGAVSTTLDLSSAYGREVRRTFALRDAGGFTVTDVIRGAKPGDRITWRVNTFADVRTTRNEARLTARTASGKTSEMRVTAPPDAIFEVTDHTRREQPFESDTPGLRQLWFTLPVPLSGERTCLVTFESAD